MSCKQIQGLKWAKAVVQPEWLPHSRPRGAKAKGLAYEAALGREIPFARRGDWFEFEDKAGIGNAQVDYLFAHEGIIYVIEVKYSLTMEGFAQIEKLYKPILERIFLREVRGIQVCKVLKPLELARSGAIVSGALAGAMAIRTGRVVWHWMGRSSVGTSLPGGLAAPLASARASA